MRSNKPERLQTSQPSLKTRRVAHRPQPGTSPGTLVRPTNANDTEIRLIAYDGYGCDELTPSREELFSVMGTDKRTLWIDVRGLADADLISDLGKAVNLHPLIIADIVHTHQRPKVEIYDDYVVVVMRLPGGTTVFGGEQLTLIIGDHFVLTFQERAEDSDDSFELVRQRLRLGKGQLRKLRSDYLAYALIDAVIDGYFPILEAYGARIENMEKNIISRPGPDLVNDTHKLKHELLELRHAIWPLREVIGALLRDDMPIFKKGTQIYLRDCADHAFQLMDILEVYREIASSLVELHLSSVSNKMNEVMKVLTVIATIFMPMTFIAGIYGMNFDRASPFNLPELGWRYGYEFALALMCCTAVAMLNYFYRKGWIGRTNTPSSPVDAG